MAGQTVDQMSRHGPTALKTGLGDPEVLRDLGDGGIGVAEDPHDVLAELLWKRLGMVHIFPAATAVTADSCVTYPIRAAVPV